MNKNNFNFRRFWRLLRIKMVEGAYGILRLPLVATLILLVVKIGSIVLSSGDLSETFLENAEYLNRVPGYLLIASYFFSFGIIFGNVENYLSLPVTNLERYLVIHTLPLTNLVIISVITHLAVEGLWRLGLWLTFPDLYVQYIEVMAGFTYNPDSILFFLPLAWYFIYLIFSIRHPMRKNWKIIFIFVIVPAIYALLLIGIHRLLKYLEVPHYNLFILGILLPTCIYLLIAAYRSFCNYEPNLEKTSTE